MLLLGAGGRAELLCKGACMRAMSSCWDYFSVWPAVTHSLHLTPSMSTINLLVYFPFQAAGKQAKLDED